jgi:hypothetical protein
MFAEDSEIQRLIDQLPHPDTALQHVTRRHGYVTTGSRMMTIERLESARPGSTELVGVSLYTKNERVRVTVRLSKEDWLALIAKVLGELALLEEY